MKRVILFAAAIAAMSVALVTVAAVWASTAMANGGVQITSATVNSDRSLSISWNTPVAIYGGSVEVNSTPTTDNTAGLPYGADTIDNEALRAGLTSYTTLRLRMTITSPTTIYVQVQLNTLLGVGNSTCDQGLNLVDCDSQVVALTVQPICSQVKTAAGYYKKVLVRQGHWLRLNGHYVTRHGHRVWVKAKYKQVWVPPGYHTECS
jgi:hypothetical protein